MWEILQKVYNNYCLVNVKNIPFRLCQISKCVMRTFYMCIYGLDFV